MQPDLNNVVNKLDINLENMFLSTRSFEQHTSLRETLFWMFHFIDGTLQIRYNEWRAGL